MWLIVEEGFDCIEVVYKLYYVCLCKLIVCMYVCFGQVIFIDCYFMLGNICILGFLEKLEIVIGDCYGISVLFWFIWVVSDIFIDFGFVIVCNKFYVGGFIIEYYGCFVCSFYVIQIEVNWLFYVDEMILEWKLEFLLVVGLLWEFMMWLVDYVVEILLDVVFVVE